MYGSEKGFLGAGKKSEKIDLVRENLNKKGIYASDRPDGLLDA